MDHSPGKNKSKRKCITWTSYKFLLKTWMIIIRRKEEEREKKEDKEVDMNANGCC